MAACARRVTRRCRWIDRRRAAERDPRRTRARARARARDSDRCDLPRDVRPRQKWIADYVAWLTEDVGLLPEVWCGMMWHDMWHDVA